MGITTTPTPPATPPRSFPVPTAFANLEKPTPLDNYVTRTLATQIMLPPLSLENWYKELVWLNVGIIVVMPIVGLYSAYYTKLRWETGVFSVLYYFFTGLGALQNCPS